MKVAVTGVSGHLGGNLVRALLEAGHQVKGLVREDRRAIEGLDIEKVSGDILDGQALNKLFADVEVVYHLAGLITLLPEHKRLARINVEGPKQVVEACLRQKVKRLVHAASIEALLHRGATRPITEEEMPTPEQVETAYGQSKARGENVIREGIARGLDAVIVNPTAVIGPFDFKISHFGQVFLDLAKRKMPTLVRGGFDLVDARDVAFGMMAAAEKGRCGERYLLASEFLTLKEVAATVEEVTGAKPPRITLRPGLIYPISFLMPPFYRLTGRRPRFTPMSIFMISENFQVDHSKAARELGFAPRPAREGIRDAITWFQQNDKLNAN